MRIKNRVSIFIMIIVILMSLNLSVFADEDRSYYIDNFLVTATVTENGDMEVEEKITYEFDGAFNGIFRTLESTGSDGIDNITVSMLDGKTEFVQNESENENTFRVITNGNNQKIQAFSKSKDEQKTFVIRYIVRKPVIKYNDTSELYWKFMGKDTDVVINNFGVVINLPASVTKADIKAFAHGPLSGNINIDDNNSVELVVERLRPNNMVEARVLFPAEALNATAKYVNEDALNRILSEEENWAEAANRKRTIARVFVGVAFLLAFIQLLMIAFIYFKYDKEYKSSFQGTYFRELPYDYSPAVMAVLWNFGHVTPKEITATLMDLVRRRALQLKTENGKKKNQSYTFSKLETNSAELKQHEQFLINWLIDDIGNGTEINLDELHSYTKTVKNAENFKKKYDKWVAMVKAEADTFKFFDGSAASGIALGIISGLIGIGFGVFTLIAHENILGFLLLIFTSVILIIYSALVKRRSKVGIEHFSKWKAFRKYLADFSMLKDAEIPAITLWEHYLVYAISLGVAKEVIKQLKVVFRDDDFKHSGLTYMYYGYYGHSMTHLNSLDHITSSITKTTESTYTQAMSTLSSKGGSGGGFSGGGGGGGGGGGAGAF
ncbi:MAG: DUF2207 domain-containing protein [Lutisporaceae bacterium]